MKYFEYLNEDLCGVMPVFDGKEMEREEEKWRERKEGEKEEKRARNVK